MIQDVCHGGKRSTEIIENLGKTSEICSKYNVDDADADAWANDYIEKLRIDKEFANHKVLIPFQTDTVI